MAASASLTFQNLSTVQDAHQPMPPTIAAATTIAPTTFLTFVTGTTNVGTITPPITGAMQTIGLVFTNASPGQLLTTGNISVGSTTVTQNKLVLLVYDPSSAKWYLNS